MKRQKRTNFWKSSKRLLTPPHLQKIMLQFYFGKVDQKALFKSPKSATYVLVHIKHNLARSLFQLCPKISNEGDKILSKKTVRELAETVIFDFFDPSSSLFPRMYQYFGRRSALSEVYSALVQSVVHIVLLQIICATLFVRGWKGSTVCLPSVAFLLVYHRQVDSAKKLGP